MSFFEHLTQFHEGLSSVFEIFSNEPITVFHTTGSTAEHDVEGTPTGITSVSPFVLSVNTALRLVCVTLDIYPSNLLNQHLQTRSSGHLHGFYVGTPTMCFNPPPFPSPALIPVGPSSLQPPTLSRETETRTCFALPPIAERAPQG